MNDTILLQEPPVEESPVTEAPRKEKGRGIGPVWQLLLVLCSGIGVGLVSLMLATGAYPVSIALGYFERPVIALLNVLPVVGLVLLFYGLTRRAGAAFLLTAGVVLGLSVGNYFKLVLRDDPLLFGDLLLLKEAGNMAGNYTLSAGKKLALAALLVIAGYLILHFMARRKPEKGKERWALVLVGVLFLGGSVPTLMSDDIYNNAAAHYGRTNPMSATQKYVAHGFLYPFLHSVKDAVSTPPEGYREEAVEAMLAQYEAGNIPEDQKVNVIGIMLEAYNDFTKFGTPELAQDVYATWHQLEEEGYSGNLVTNIFAGGTVDTERCFLTGLTELPEFRSNSNSYAWYFRSQGYTVEGMHPCFDWFYNRLNVNEYLGFEDYKFVENYFGQFTDGAVAMDKIFFPELLKAYQEKTAAGEPYFNFSVTYQGHGPYEDYICWWGEKGEFVKEDPARSEEAQYILDNYFGSIADTDAHLKELTDYLREDETPVILVLFGDHDPWLGDGNWVYHDLGINLDLSTEEGFYNYYATRYIIWANDAAKEALGRDLTGEGPAISPNYLMTELFDLCGWEGPAYMQATRPAKEAVPVINVPTGLYVENGELTGTLSEEGGVLVKQYKELQYNWQDKFLYEDEAE